MQTSFFSVQGYKHFRSNLITTCSVTCLDCQRDFGRSDDIFCQNAPPVWLMVWEWLGSKNLWNSLSFCQGCRKRPFWSFIDLLEQGRYVVCNDRSYTLSHQAPHFIQRDPFALHIRVNPVVFTRHNLQAARRWSVDSSASLLTRTPGTDWNKWAETVQKSINKLWPKRISAHQVCSCKYLSWK